jgi:hypothetical protein
MLYTMLIYGDPAGAPEFSSSEGQAMHDRWMTYSQEIQDSGIVRGGSALQPADTATTVRARDGETLLTDGPFAETKEVLGGFYLIDVPDVDAALAWAAKAPNVADGGSVELRPVMTFD